MAENELIGLFDTHAHPTDERFDEDRTEVLARMRQADMLCMCVGADMASSAQSVALAKENENIYAAVGVHPHDAKKFTEADVPQLIEWITQEKKVKALGEIGLDYFYDLSPREVQKTVFERQLDLAYELHAPVILHIRDAHGDTIEILRAHRERLPRCVIHCCSASWESAKIYLSLGCMISFAGPVTFKKSVNLQEVAKNVPLDRLMIETDSPYLAPIPNRGKRNSSLNIPYVVEKIAEIKGVSREEVEEVTWKNSFRVFSKVN